MTSYRVVTAMLTPVAFPESIKLTSMRAYYYGDVVLGAQQADIDRLLAEGYLEAVPDARHEAPVEPIEAVGA